MAQVADVANLVFQSRQFLRDLRDTPTSRGPLMQLHMVLQASQAWQRQVQLSLAPSVRPLLPELLTLLHVLGSELNSTGVEEASWTSMLSASSMLLRTLRLLMNVTLSANSSIIASSSAVTLPSAGTGTMCASLVAEHCWQSTQAGMAAGKLLEKIAATLQLTAAVPKAAQRAACQACSLAAGHAALKLLAYVKPLKNTANGLQHIANDAARLVLFAAGILWCEADVGDQHGVAAMVLIDFGASVYNEGEFGVDSFTDAATDLVLAAGECGAMLQGPLIIGTKLDHMAAVDTWTTWLLRSAGHFRALLHSHGRSSRSLSHMQTHRLTAAACTQLKRLLAAKHAGNANFTKWQGRLITTCGTAAVALATLTVTDRSQNEGLLSGSRDAFRRTYIAVQTDMLAMAHAGVLRTFSAVAHWLLMHNRAVGSARTGNNSGSKSPTQFSESLISAIISVPNILGKHLLATILDDPCSPINRPPQREVSSTAIIYLGPPLCLPLSQCMQMFIAVYGS